MNTDFPHITILGGGLLGGSLARAIGALENPPAIRLWARKRETVTAATALGIPNGTTDLAEAVQDASLLVLAVPVGSMARLVSSAMEAGLPSHCLITDVGSVKATPHREIGQVLHGHGNHFIGSHPMAGSERNGLSAATVDLFENAACLLTNDAGAPADLAASLERFWQKIGCRTSWMSAAIHDELVARISHLPHLIAASAARVCLKNPAESRFGGGGLRDTTRVAAGNPVMWAEIVIENRQAIIAPLQETIADLREILTALESGDQEQAQRWLTLAKQKRDTVPPPSQFA